jgi:dinuclear metal center YbgI/SA1388 family protein
MNIQQVINSLEQLAPPSLQESYDNAGLLTGNPNWHCKGIMLCLDATLEVIEEAIANHCNLIVTHHPIIFSGLKKINGKNYIEKAVIKAIKYDIAIYAIHTNLDNVIFGVNAAIADKIGLVNRSVLVPKENSLCKLYTFVPLNHTERVRAAIFEAGAGHIGNYSECSFESEGLGTFKGDNGTNPYVGRPGLRHTERENKLEVIFPAWLQPKILKALIEAHPYEEVAYDIVPLANKFQKVGSGLIGDLVSATTEADMLKKLKETFSLQVIRHTAFTGKMIRKVAICGGAGSFLISRAASAGADLYITGDVKYHEFFDANASMLLADIGHYESEQFTIDLLFDHLQLKFPTFAVLKTTVLTNPVRYFI